MNLRLRLIGPRFGGQALDHLGRPWDVPVPFPDGPKLLVAVQVGRVDGVVHADLVEVPVLARLAVDHLVLLDPPHEVSQRLVAAELPEQA
ncbi:MAG TPA: hypothetical protein VM490_09065, partial [Armatimonadaceae bacterium]|nr:hypothetical protein [Armatimonadaceae bacterium]